MDSSAPSYVGFGMLTPVAIMVVNQLPEHNTGAIVKDVNEFIFDDAAQRGDESPMDVAEKLIHQGVKTALITMAEKGCLAVQGEEVIRIHAPSVRAVDGCGAGATFSAGFIYGYLHNWNLEKSLRFATAAASLKVTKAGLLMFPIEEIRSLASKLEVKYPAINGKL